MIRIIWKLAALAKGVNHIVAAAAFSILIIVQTRQILRERGPTQHRPWKIFEKGSEMMKDKTGARQ